MVTHNYTGTKMNTLFLVTLCLFIIVTTVSGHSHVITEDFEGVKTATDENSMEVQSGHRHSQQSERRKRCFFSSSNRAPSTMNWEIIPRTQIQLPPQRYVPFGSNPYYATPMRAY